MCIWRKQVFQGVCNIIWRVVNVHSTATADWLLVFFRYTTPATTPTKATAPTPTAIRESGDSASTLLFNLKKRTLHVVWLVLNHTYLTHIINSMLCVSLSLVYSLCILLWVYPWYTMGFDVCRIHHVLTCTDDVLTLKVNFFVSSPDHD